MKCSKCGKEINDKVKFCKYCGSLVEDDGQKVTEELSSPEYKSKGVNKRKWIIPVCSVVAAALFICIGVFAIGIKNGNDGSIKKEEPVQETAKEELTAEPKEEQPAEPEAEKEPEVTYPKDITLDAEVQNKVTEFLDLLCMMDTSNMGHNFAVNRAIDSNFVSRFLIGSVQSEVPFADGQPVEGWSIPEDTVREYLSTSIGVSDCTSEGISISDGVVSITPVTMTCAYGNDAPQITKVTQLSETDIQVLGRVNYIPEFQDEPYTAEFDVTLTANPESMWGGYTLKSINRWDETLDVQMKKFVETLGWCDHTATWMADGKSFKEFSSADLSKSFLRMVINFNMGNKRDEIAAKYGYAELQEGKGAYYIPEETAKQLLIDSIGQYDNSTMDYEGDKIVSPLADLGSTGVENVTILDITNISDTDIKVDGDIVFHEEGRITRNVSVSITMTANPESIWGGYTLKSIDKWEEIANPTMESITKQDFNLSASSTLQQAGYDYSVGSLLDGNTQTCWAEGVSGTGEGESITFSSDETKTVSGLAILPGYCKSEDLFYKNGMPLDIEITSGDKTWKWSFYGFEPNFSSPMDSMVFIDFGGDIDMNECTVTLSACKSGNKYDDICITEMFLYKK